MNLESGVLQVHIEDIIPNRFQPRLTFDEQGLKELSDSIREHGIIQPLVLRKLGDKFEIIAGERRYKAAQIAGLTTVPAVIANIDDNKSAEVALVENVQRRDLTAIEEARSYKSLLDKGYLTQEQLAKRMGLSQPSIANKLRLLNLDEEVQQALLEEKISERHARTLLTLQDKAAQKEWLHRIINERLTVRQLDMELKKIKESEDDGGDVPIVSSIPSIEDIKANAMDIGMANRLESTQKVEQLETLDTPETLDTLDMNPINNQGFNNISNPSPFPTYNPMNNNQSNSFTTATTIPEFNIATPNSASTFVPNENLTPISNDNKFFGGNDFLSSPQPNNNSMFNQNNGLNETTGGFEVFDAPTNDNSFITQPQKSLEPSIPTPATPMSSMEMNNNTPFSSTFDMSPSNKFFTPTPEIPRDITIENNNDTMVDPMSAVDKLMGNNSNSSSNSGKMELKDAIAEIRTAIEGLGDKGFFIDVEEIDFDSNYQITMRIHKD